MLARKCEVKMQVCVLVLGKDSEPYTALAIAYPQARRKSETGLQTYLDQFLGHGGGCENTRFSDDA